MQSTEEAAGTTGTAPDGRARRTRTTTPGSAPAASRRTRRVQPPAAEPPPSPEPPEAAATEIASPPEPPAAAAATQMPAPPAPPAQPAESGAEVLAFKALVLQAARTRFQDDPTREPLTEAQLTYLLDLLHQEGQPKTLVSETYLYLRRGMSKAHASVQIDKLNGTFGQPQQRLAA